MTRAIEHETRLGKLESDVNKLFQILEEALKLGAKNAKQKGKEKKAGKKGKK